VRRLPEPTRPILAHAAMLAAALLVPVVARRLSERAAWIVRVVFCLAIVPVAFDEVGRAIPFISPDSREYWLTRADKILLGSDPTRWTGSVESLPLLTELMQLVYTSFYFLALALSIRLFLKRDYRAIEHAMLVLVIGFLLSYLGYFLVPARGPERFLPHGAPLEGVAAAAAVRAWIDRVEPVKRDCFPSGHAEISLLVAALAWRYHRPAFLLLGPVALLLAFSTVYLRYHYAVDVLAGAALAAVALLATGRLMRPLRG